MRMANRYGGRKAAEIIAFFVYLLALSALILPDYDGFVNHFYAARWIAGGFCSALAAVVIFFLSRSGAGLILRSCCVAMSVVTAVALAVAWWNHFHDDGPYLRGTFDNPTGLALTLLLCCPFILQVKDNVFWLWAVGSLIGISLAFTQCRTALLLFCLFLALRYRHRRYILAGVFPLAVVSVLLFVQKSGSTSGRWFIIQRTLELAAQSPWIGWGRYGFQREYMPHQAEWLMAHPDSSYAMLAGNITHPYCDYLLILVNYGIIGLTVVVGLLIAVMWQLRKTAGWYSPFSQSMFLLLGFAVFSYPSEYPFSWFILAQALVVALWRSPGLQPLIRNSVVSYLAVPVICLSVMTLCIGETFRQKAWYEVFRQMPWTSPKENVARLSAIQGKWRDDEFFLFHLASNYLMARNYSQCQAALDKRAQIARDYYQEEMQGRLYLEKGEYENALRHFGIASAMFPVKLYPRYQMFVLNRRLGNLEACREIQRTVREMPIKVPSARADLYRRAILWDPLQDSLSDNPSPGL